MRAEAMHMYHSTHSALGKHLLKERINNSTQELCQNYFLSLELRCSPNSSQEKQSISKVLDLSLI